MPADADEHHRRRDTDPDRAAPGEDPCALSPAIPSSGRSPCRPCTSSTNTCAACPIQAMAEIAELLEITPAEVHDTMSFYGFFPQAPIGDVRVWVCRSISCMLRGGEEMLDHACKKLGIEPGETTADGKLTVEFAECLGICDFAPAGRSSTSMQLMNGLVAYGRRVTIVLDDLHAVRSDFRALARPRDRAVASQCAPGRLDAFRPGARRRAPAGAQAAHGAAPGSWRSPSQETHELERRGGINLSSESVELLVDRTEGGRRACIWTRMASRSQDPNRGVPEFAGSARHVGDYLTDEVLTALAPDIKDFLVRRRHLGTSPRAVRRGSRARGLG